tara:strand:+ start:174 stop:1103 length:930 start_codon:yes stop_codon:yes gene_type:complete
MKNYCLFCDYTTSNTKDFKRHLMTAKHKIQQNTTKIQPLHNNLICDCGKSYSHRASLYNHRKKCAQKSPKIPKSQSSYDKSRPDNIEPNCIVSILQQNQDFKELLIDQNMRMLQQQTENQKLQKQLVEAVSDTTTINHITNTTHNNNQKFNLNFFLNTTCKDAMNMSEFIENINAEFKDIENIGKNGYITGMTEMILSRIRDLDITKRPLHCTDLKREIMYIKDNDEWSKDSRENIKLRDMITIVAKQNCNTLPSWREEYPECNKWDHPKYKLCIDMMRNVLGDVGYEQVKLDNKIIKNLSKELIITRN